MTSTAINPYQVLGVERNASQEEIKAAYRKLALRYHPDRNPGDKQAEERFKEVSQAYATLRDPEARARFDRFGNAGGRPDFDSVDWQTIFREADIHVNWDPHRGMPKTGNAVFDMLFGAVAGMMRNSGLLPGEHRDVTAQLSLPFARQGGAVRVKVPGTSICPNCRGSGHSDGAACPACGGRGVQRGGSLVDVQVPAGVKPGTKLRLRGLGGPGTPPGDVFVTIDVALPPDVQRLGNELRAELYLTAWERQRGITSEVLGVPVRVPPGTRDGAILRVAGGGLGGDLLVTIREDLWRGLRRLATDWLRRVTRSGLPHAAKE